MTKLSRELAKLFAYFHHVEVALSKLKLSLLSVPAPERLYTHRTNLSRHGGRWVRASVSLVDNAWQGRLRGWRASWLAGEVLVCLSPTATGNNYARLTETFCPPPRENVGGGETTATRSHSHALFSDLHPFEFFDEIFFCFCSLTWVRLTAVVVLNMFFFLKIQSDLNRNNARHRRTP